MRIRGHRTRRVGLVALITTTITTLIAGGWALRRRQAVAPLEDGQDDGELPPILAVPVPVAPEHVGPRLSAKCGEGKHGACLGKYTVYPLRNGQRFQLCECPVCNHPRPPRWKPQPVALAKPEPPAGS